MEKLSLIKKINILLSIIKTSPLFIISFIIGISLILLMILDLKTTKKIRDKLLILIWILVVGFIGYRYCNYLLKLSDNLVEEVFTAIYFPNLAIYTIIIITTNITLFISLISKRTNIAYKVANIFSTTILDFLFILTLEIIVKDNINVYKELTIYSNKNLLTLIELSSGIYTLWLFLIGFIRLVLKTIPNKVKDEIKEEIKDKIEIPILYEAPKSNIYENNQYSKPLNIINDDTVNYTNIFNQKPTIPVIEKSKTSDERVIPIIEKTKSIEIPIIQNHETSKKISKGFFNKKNKEIPQDTYRVPLFDTISDDALLDCIVPIEKPTIEPIANISIKLDGKELLERFNRGEELSVDQYKILKEYIITKQG